MGMMRSEVASICYPLPTELLVSRGFLLCLFTLFLFLTASDPREVVAGVSGVSGMGITGNWLGEWLKVDLPG